VAQDDSVLREVDRSLAEERQMELFRKRGPAILSAAAAIVLAVGGWQFWNYRQNEQAARAATEFHDTLATLSENSEDGRLALEAFAADAPSGYAVLARMRAAAELANSGEREAAIAGYRSVAGDGGAPQRLRDLARLRAGYLALEDGRDSVLSVLGSLTESQTVFGYYARELSAVAALDRGDFEVARQMFVRAAADANTPEAIRMRAEEFAALAAAGRAGVRLDETMRAEDLFRAVGEGVGDPHSGHNHDHDHDHDHEDDADAAHSFQPMTDAETARSDSGDSGQDE
jgi:hypothetical protein